MSKERIGRGEKLHIYASGVVMLLLILALIGIVIAGSVICYLL
jgi:hypothetical protein